MAATRALRTEVLHRAARWFPPDDPGRGASRDSCAPRWRVGAMRWGGIDEADYREQPADLRSQLAISERAPEERRILEAVRLAQDIPRLWAAVTAEQRRRTVWSTSETDQDLRGPSDLGDPAAGARLAPGRSSSRQRSRPGSNPSVFAAGIAIEGLDDFLGLEDPLSSIRSRLCDVTSPTEYCVSR